MPPDYENYGRRLIKNGDKGQPAHRRKILLETLQFFSSPTARNTALQTALDNVSRWRSSNGIKEKPPLDFAARVSVVEGDWGAVTHAVTREHGVIFAVLNMANAWVPGGGYVEGMPAQEENMFRRTDCHFSITSHEFSREEDRYLPRVTDLINGKNGRVSLDITRPRVCVRGPEVSNKPDLGYEWLKEEDVFPFYELKAAAVDLRGNRKFDERELGRRIRAQLDTLIEKKLEHVVLSAFGCGAFRNPAAAVARQYRLAIEERLQHFTCIVFAIYHPGYGPNNLAPFQAVFSAPSLAGAELSELPSEVSDGYDTDASESANHNIDQKEKEALAADFVEAGGASKVLAVVRNSLIGVRNFASHARNGSRVLWKDKKDKGSRGSQVSSTIGSSSSSSSATSRASTSSSVGDDFSSPRATDNSDRSRDINENNQSSPTEKTMFQWYWANNQGWIAYDEPENANLEKHAGSANFVVKLSNSHYVDLKQMKQFRVDDNSRWRHIKREQKHVPMEQG